MQKAIQVAKLAALTTVAVLAITLSVCVWRVSTEVTGAVGHIRLATARAERLAATYEEELASDKNRKAIEAGIAAAASWQATARLVNTTTIPAINRTLGELEATGRELAALVEEQNGNATNIAADSRRVVKALEKTVTQTTETVGELGEAGRKLGADTSRALEEATGAIQSFKGVSRNLERASGELAEIGANLRVASESAPGIAQGVEKVASKAPWYQKLAAYGGLLMGIGSLVWR